MDSPRLAQDARERMAAAFEQRRHQAAPVAAGAATPALDMLDAVAAPVARLERELADREHALAARERQLDEQLARLAVTAKHCVRH